MGSEDSDTCTRTACPAEAVPNRDDAPLGRLKLWHEPGKLMLYAFQVLNRRERSERSKRPQPAALSLKLLLTTLTLLSAMAAAANIGGISQPVSG
jgi:hypothetical protein